MNYLDKLILPTCLNDVYHHNDYAYGLQINTYSRSGLDRILTYEENREIDKLFDDLMKKYRAHTISYQTLCDIVDSKRQTIMLNNHKMEFIGWLANHSFSPRDVYIDRCLHSNPSIEYHEEEVKIIGYLSRLYFYFATREVGNEKNLLRFLVNCIRINDISSFYPIIPNKYLHSGYFNTTDRREIMLQAAVSNFSICLNPEKSNSKAKPSIF